MNLILTLKMWEEQLVVLKKVALIPRFQSSNLIQVHKKILPKCTVNIHLRILTTPESLLRSQEMEKD
jgi:hypothetical protein